MIDHVGIYGSRVAEGLSAFNVGLVKQGDGTGTRAAYMPVTPDIMLVSQAKSRGLVLRGVALHQQDATEIPPPPSVNSTH